MSCRVGLAHAALLGQTINWYAKVRLRKDGQGLAGMEMTFCCQKRRASERESTEPRRGVSGFVWLHRAAAVSAQLHHLLMFHSPPGLPFYSLALASISSHSCGHFLILIALSHPCQLIIELHFVIIYCTQQRERVKAEMWRRGERKRELT